MKKAIKIAFRGVNILVIIALVMAYLTPYVSPKAFALPAVFGLGFPFSIVACFLMLAAWWFFYKKILWLNIICLIAGFNHISNTFAFNLSDTGVRNNSITVITNNTTHLRNGEHNDLEMKKDQADDFLDLYKKYNPDIVAMQEAYLPKELKSFVDNYFDTEMGLEHHYQDIHLVIYSKYPIVNKGQITPQDAKYPKCIFVDLKIDTAIIRVYNIHLQSNKISSDANTLIEEGSTLKDKETRQQVKSIFSRFKWSAKIRSDQAKVIKTHIEGSPHPVIVCGDFNDTPTSYTYHTLNKGLKDTFHKKRFGIEATYAGKIPGLRIDYILASKSISVYRHEKITKAYSDHYPVLVEVGY